MGNHRRLTSLAFATLILTGGACSTSSTTDAGNPAGTPATTMSDGTGTGGGPSAPSAGSTTEPAGEHDSHAPGTYVAIDTFQYDPNPLDVKKGTVITVENKDDILHTATAGKRGEPTGEFDVQLDGQGSTGEIRFDEAGTFDYHCTIHPGMDATVTVT